MKPVNILAVVQARLSSKRFPNKVLQEISGDLLINFMLNRIKLAQFVDGVVIATSDDLDGNKIVSEASGNVFYQGSLNNVRSRFVDISRLFKPSHIIRLTADCPLICPVLIDQVVEEHLNAGADYTANCNYRGFPSGFNVEIFKASLMLEDRFLTLDSNHQEHVTPLFYQSNSGYRVHNVCFSEWRTAKNYRFDVDYPEDLQSIKRLLGESKVTFPFFSDLWELQQKLSKINKLFFNASEGPSKL